METNWFEIAKQICLPLPVQIDELPEHIDGECDQCGEEVDEGVNLCPRCIRRNAHCDAMDAKRDMQIERELEGKR